MEMEEDNYPGGIIELLLERDLTNLCFQIYNELDSKSLTNCRLVCHSWRNFIDHFFYELPKGKACLQRKLIKNVFGSEYVPTTKTMTLDNDEDFGSSIYDIQADKSGICVSTGKKKFKSWIIV